MNDWPIHPAATIFPEMDAASFAALKVDLQRYGQIEPVVIHEGKLLDGRHRARACKELGIFCRSVVWEGDDPIAYVISSNLHRRHLTPSQLSMCAARAREMYDEKAKKRQQEAAARGNRTRHGNESPVMENFPQPGTARDQVGEVFGVSGKTVDYATKVLQNAEPEIIQAVDEGRMAVSTAAIYSTEPPEVQRQEAINPKRRRTYKSVSKPSHAEQEEEAPIPNGDSRGKGVTLAQEAINCLTRIPKNDPLRKLGLQLVTDWIRRNK